MTYSTRRNFALALGATTAVAACGNGVGNSNAATIDARVNQTLSTLYNEHPGTQELGNKAVGILVMPLVTEAGFGLGGSFGRGALRVGGATVDYYSQVKGSGGFQIGAQQFSHVLFFMTNEALTNFRRSEGYAVGANASVAVLNDGAALNAETTTTLAPTVAVIFGQAGLKIGATLEGVKYTRIIP